MLAKIQKWGNSQGIRLTKNILTDAQIEVGDEVNLSVKNGVIVVVPVKKVRGRYKLEDLITNIPENYQNNEFDWGNPVGKEVW
jgi:antitoxin MazE